MSSEKVCSKNSSEVVFLLGSGASVKAGVPDTFEFVKEFIVSIDDIDKKKTVKKVIDILKEWKVTDIDVELLLDTLIKLDAKDKEPLLRFFKNGEFILSGYLDKYPIIRDLKDFIKKKAIVQSDKIKYLEPFLGFVEEFHPLDIISVNYDICIEQFCNVYKLTYQDGFDVHWNPKVFETENTDIRLYKLHGSTMWYQSDRGGYIKLPVMSERSGIQLITGEKAENLMLYPMQKWDYAEPLLELLVEVKHRLESENCNFLIAVGYSFRDEHIKRIIWDVAKKNRNLNLIIIDPKAYQIYAEKLKYYDTIGKIPSSLDGRVSCLPFKFEEILPYLKDYYLKNLRQGLGCLTNQQQTELKGEKANWLSCLKPLINAGQVEKVEETLKKIDPLELERDWQLDLELPLKMFVSLAINNQKEKAQEYLNRLKREIRLMLIERMNVEIMKEHVMGMVQIGFNYIRTGTGASYISAKMFKNFITDLNTYLKNVKEMILLKQSELIEIFEYFSRLQNYFEPFEENGIECNGYLNLREKMIKTRVNIKEVRNMISDFEEGDYGSASFAQVVEELPKIIMEIEKKILMMEVKV